MAKIRADIYDTPAESPAVFWMDLWSKVFGAKTVANCVGSDILSNDECKYGYKYDSWIKRFMTRWVLRLSDRIVTVAAFPREVLKELNPSLPGKTSVVHVGIDTKKFKPDAAARKKMREKLGLSPDTPLILHVGVFVPIKAHDVLFKALARMKNRDFKVVLVQQLELNEKHAAKMKKLLEDLGLKDRVIFLDPRTHGEVAELFNACDVYVHPSRSEMHPRALLEAMSCERAVVGSSIPAITEIVTDGVSGVIFTEGDDAELAEKIVGVLDDPELGKRLGKKAREKVLGEYTVEESAEKRFRLYSELAGKR